MEHFYQNIGEDWMDYQGLYSEMVNHFTDNSHFVEIGSWKGRSASYMAVEIYNSRKNIKFDCVDTWCGSVEHLDSNSCYFQQELINDKDWLYYQFLQNTRPVCDTIIPIRMTSLDAVSLYENRSLDFIFIDASHEYEDVKKDIIAWYPKLKLGGIIAGHDYTSYDGVKKAVDEILINKNLNIRLENSYWIHKKN
jgi:hypothetical protein